VLRTVRSTHAEAHGVTLTRSLARLLVRAVLLPVGSSQVGEFVSATDQVVFKTHLDPFTDALYLRYTLSSVKLGVR